MRLNKNLRPSLSGSPYPQAGDPPPISFWEKVLSGILRPVQFRIGNRLILSFITIVVLMAAGYSLTLWQFRELLSQQQDLDRAQLKSAAVLNLHAHLFALRDKLEDLADSHDGAQFVLEAPVLRKAILADVERAKRALYGPPSYNERDSFLLGSLSAIESALPVQIDALVSLAKAEDWSAIQLRSQNQEKQLSYLTSSLVDKVAEEVTGERARVFTSIQLTEHRAVVVLLGAGTLTLLVVAALGLSVTRSITRPLSMLGIGAQALARGEFEYQVPVAGKDELADLGNVFNHATRQLRDLYQNLQKSEARFRSLIEHSSDFIFVLDREGTIRYVSPSSQRALRLGSEGLVGEEFFVLIHPGDLTSVRSALNDQTPNAIRAFEFRCRYPGGETRVIEAVKTNLLDNHAVAGIVINARDVTERRRAQEELRRSEAFLTEGERLSHTGSWGWKPLNDELTWSQGQFRILGCGACKPSLDLFWRRVHWEDRPRVRRAYERAAREKSDIATEFRVARRDGSIRFIRSVGHAVIDESGQLVEFIGTSMDITERKRAEDSLQQAKGELAHVARVASMGELTASIAHEVGQPLTGIVVNAQAGLRWLTAEPANLDKARETLERISRDGDRAAAVVTRIRAFFRKSPYRAEPLNIGETILEVTALFGSELRSKDVSLETHLADDLPIIVGDRVQLQQVILNLVVNAIEAMCGTDGPRVLVLSSTKDRSVEGVVVRVRDSGPGLDLVNPKKLFEPFYTTKSEGMGMGLRICRSIVEAHGGRIRAISNAEKGATFEFTLPVGKYPLESRDKA